MMTQPELTGTHLGTGHKSSVNVAAFKRDFNAINVIQDRNIERLKGEALMLCTQYYTHMHFIYNNVTFASKQEIKIYIHWLSCG